MRVFWFSLHVRLTTTTTTTKIFVCAQSGRQSVKRNHAEEECGNPEDATGWGVGLRPVDVNAADGAEARSPARKRATR